MQTALKGETDPYQMDTSDLVVPEADRTPESFQRRRYLQAYYDGLNSEYLTEQDRKDFKKKNAAKIEPGMGQEDIDNLFRNTVFNETFKNSKNIEDNIIYEKRKELIEYEEDRDLLMSKKLSRDRADKSDHYGLEVYKRGDDYLRSLVDNRKLDIKKALLQRAIEDEEFKHDALHELDIMSDNISSYYRKYKDTDKLNLSDEEKFDVLADFYAAEQVAGQEYAGRVIANDYQNRVAANQGLMEKAGCTAVQFFDDIAGFLIRLYGMAQGLSRVDKLFGNTPSDYLKNIIDNDITRYGDRVTSTQSWDPTEQEKLEAEGLSEFEILNTYDQSRSLFTINTPFELLGQYGFTVASTIGSFGVSNLIRLGGKAAAWAAKAVTQGARLSVGTARTIMRTEKWFQKLVPAIMGTVEGGTEAYQTKVASLRNFQESIDNRYNQIVDNDIEEYGKKRGYDDAYIEELKSNTELRQYFEAQHSNEKQEAYKEAENQATNAMYINFVGNSAINGFINSTWQATQMAPRVQNALRRSLLGSEKNRLDEIIDIVRKGDKWTAKAKNITRKQIIKNSFKESFSEGMEEYWQNLSDAFAQGYTTDNMNRYLDNKYNAGLGNSSAFSDVFDSIGAGLQETLQSSISMDSFKSFLYGALSTAIGGLNMNVKQGKNGNMTVDKHFITWKSGILSAFGNGYKNEIMEGREDIAKEINKFLNDKKIQDSLFNASGVAEWISQYYGAINNKDEKAARDARLGALFSNLMTLQRLKGTEYYRTVMEQLNRMANLSTDDLVDPSSDASKFASELLVSQAFRGENYNAEEALGEVVKNSKEMLDLMKKSEDISNKLDKSLSIRVDDDTKAAMVFNQIVVDDQTKRRKQLTEEIDKTKDKINEVSGEDSDVSSSERTAISRHGSLARAQAHLETINKEIEEAEKKLKEAKETAKKENKENYRAIKHSIDKKDRKSNKDTYIETATKHEKEIRKAQDTLKGLRAELKETRKDIKHLEDLTETTESEEGVSTTSTRVLSAREIMQLSNRDRARMLKSANRKNYSEEQQAEIDKVINAGTSIYSDFVTKITDLDRLDFSIESATASQTELLRNPEVLDKYRISVMSQAKLRAMQKANADILDITDYNEFAERLDYIFRGEDAFTMQAVTDMLADPELASENTMRMFAQWVLNTTEADKIKRWGVRRDFLNNEADVRTELIDGVFSFLQNKGIDLTNVDEAVNAMSATNSEGLNEFQQYITNLSSIKEFEGMNSHSLDETISLYKDLMTQYNKEKAENEARTTPIEVTDTKSEDSDPATAPTPTITSEETEDEVEDDDTRYTAYEEEEGPTLVRSSEEEEDYANEEDDFTKISALEEEDFKIDTEGDINTQIDKVAKEARDNIEAVLGTNLEAVNSLFNAINIRFKNNTTNRLLALKKLNIVAKLAKDSKTKVGFTEALESYFRVNDLTSSSQDSIDNSLQNSIDNNLDIRNNVEADAINYINKAMAPLIATKLSSPIRRREAVNRARTARSIDNTNADLNRRARPRPRINERTGREVAPNAAGMQAIDLQSIKQSGKATALINFEGKHHILDYLNITGSDLRTKPVFFITPKSLRDEVKDSMGGRYKEDSSMPVVAVVEISDEEYEKSNRMYGNIEIKETAIVDGKEQTVTKHYQPIAILPANTNTSLNGVENAARVRQAGTVGGFDTLYKDSRGNPMRSSVTKVETESPGYDSSNPNRRYSLKSILLADVKANRSTDSTASLLKRSSQSDSPMWSAKSRFIQSLYSTKPQSISELQDLLSEKGDKLKYKNSKGEIVTTKKYTLSEEGKLIVNESLEPESENAKMLDTIIAQQQRNDHHFIFRLMDTGKGTYKFNRIFIAGMHEATTKSGVNLLDVFSSENPDIDDLLANPKFAKVSEDLKDFFAKSLKDITLSTTGLSGDGESKLNEYSKELTKTISHTLNLDGEFKFSLAGERDGNPVFNLEFTDQFGGTHQILNEVSNGSLSDEEVFGFLKNLITDTNNEGKLEIRMSTDNSSAIKFQIPVFDSNKELNKSEDKVAKAQKTSLEVALDANILQVTTPGSYRMSNVVIQSPFLAGTDNLRPTVTADASNAGSQSSGTTGARPTRATVETSNGTIVDTDSGAVLDKPKEGDNAEGKPKPKEVSIMVQRTLDGLKSIQTIASRIKLSDDESYYTLDGEELFTNFARVTSVKAADVNESRFEKVLLNGYSSVSSPTEGYMLKADDSDTYYKIDTQRVSSQQVIMVSTSDINSPEMSWRDVTNEDLDAETQDKIRNYFNGIGTENPWIKPSTTIGNNVDDLTRDFFDESLDITSLSKEELQKRYPALPIKTINNLISDLKTLKDKWDSEGKTVVSKGITVKGTLNVTDKNGKKYSLPVAGTLDLVLVDSYGNMEIWDMKTHRSELNGEEALRAKYGRQLYIYSKLLEAQMAELGTPARVTNLGIVSFQTDKYDMVSRGGRRINYTSEDGRKLSANGKEVTVPVEFKGATSIGTSIALDLRYEKLTNEERMLLNEIINSQDDTSSLEVKDDSTDNTLDDTSNTDAADTTQDKSNEEVKPIEVEKAEVKGPEVTVITDSTGIKRSALKSTRRRRNGQPSTASQNPLTDTPLPSATNPKYDLTKFDGLEITDSEGKKLEGDDRIKEIKNRLMGKLGINKENLEKAEKELKERWDKMHDEERDHFLDCCH
jgi:hypothetical protein